MSKKLIQDKKSKAAYEKPEVIHRQVMETIAGACSQTDPINGKVGGATDQCTFLSS